MKCIDMSYRDFTFRANPESISVIMSKRISESPMLFQRTKVQEVCEEACVISGKGCFTGNNAESNAYRLMTVFKAKGSAYLFSPVLAPRKMYFSRLSISANADKNCIDYAFSFTEDCSSKKRYRDFKYTYALQGENLFDIANRTDTSVETIFDLNSFKDLFSVEQGDKIWLR